MNNEGLYDVIQIMHAVVWKYCNRHYPDSALLDVAEISMYGSDYARSYIWGVGGDYTRLCIILFGLEEKIIEQEFPKTDFYAYFRITVDPDTGYTIEKLWEEGDDD